MNKQSLYKVWESYYSKVKDTALKDKYLFSLEVEAIIKELKSYINVKGNKRLSLLEIGCGTGVLASELYKSGLLKWIEYSGVDFSPKAITKARRRNIRNAQFICCDFFNYFENLDKKFDIIISQRSIMAITNPTKQREFLSLISKSKNESGIGIFSEVTYKAYKKLNLLRKKLHLPPLAKVWHSRHLRITELEKYFTQVTEKDYFSTYILITRVIYPYFVKVPVHNTEIAKFASTLPQQGDYSYLKLLIIK